MSLAITARLHAATHRTPTAPPAPPRPAEVARLAAQAVQRRRLVQRLCAMAEPALFMVLAVLVTLAIAVWMAPPQAAPSAAHDGARPAPAASA
jgi:hypothetical protein